MTYGTLGDTFNLAGSLRTFLVRNGLRLAGCAALIAAGLTAAALLTWRADDPSLSHAVDRPVENLLGFLGAALADLLMQFVGLGAIIVVGAMAILALALLRARTPARPLRRTGMAVAGLLLFSAALACLPVTARWPLPTSLGGAVGDVLLRIPAALLGGPLSVGVRAAVGALAGGLSLMLLAFAAGWSQASAKDARRRKLTAVGRKPRKVRDEARFEEFGPADPADEPERGAPLRLVAGILAHWALSARGMLRRRLRHLPGSALALLRRSPESAAPLRQHEPSFDPDADAEPLRPGVLDADGTEVSGMGVNGTETDEDFDDPDVEAPARAMRPAPSARGAASPRGNAPTRGRVAPRRGDAVPPPGGPYALPSLSLLEMPEQRRRDPSLDPAALQENARRLEAVLGDFGVRGEIIHVRPGPVVTLYELEPAPGIKSSRVIGLADDIARSMSAIAARVAVVPGRNAIGIELPNRVRETVYLRELFAAADFQNTKQKLALTLGKTIGGEAVIADLARMPHLLVAGTTGSGKSVAINTMILSLLYRLTPEECRLIMIDPKMLELSVYDGIPHLLTPVVTDPKKAVVALKWTVREMEERYRKMSKLGVRNVEGFNQRIALAQKRGEVITRTVQTGFDHDFGEPMFETEELDLAPIPYIVVLIDEMADLMMVAGKDIEGAIQRLAQMARAAGIHVIMATQRPSVDVITGTIKANFPTRISFQVTSKIDSRTILGEQGAEQLLGQGDMLYMAGGGRIQRVHGPFVSDQEVEEVVAHLKRQGSPDYLDAITDEDEDSEAVAEALSGGSEEGADLYDQAVAVVLRDRKVSTSYIQRRLGIGYNRAASLIERMEKEGVIGPANHAGKRAILVGEDGAAA